MNIKINREQLNQLIKEEVDRYKKIQELEMKKQKIDEALQKLEEGENIDELWGGIKQLFNKGTAAAGKNMAQGYNTTKTGLKQLGQDFADVYGQAAKGIADTGSKIKQTYQHGERIAQTSKTQKALNAAYAEKNALDSKIKNLQAQHKELTGKPYLPTQRNYKAPQALPPQAKQAVAPVPMVQTKPAQE